MKHTTTNISTTNATKTSAASAAHPLDITLDEQIAGASPAVNASTRTAVTSAPALLPSTPRVLYLDPRTIYEGAGKNRAESAYASDEFEQLAVSILAMGGNTQPIVARPVTATDVLPAGTAYEYVLVSGARRLRACKQHQLQVHAIVTDKLTPLDESLHRLAENFNRESLCAVELGWQVQFIREQHADAKLSDAAIGRMIGADKSAVSKALSLASLPRQIIECFEYIKHLRYSDAKPLTDAFSAAPHAVLEAAEQIRSGPQLKATEVLQRLTKAAADATRSGANAAKKPGVEPFNTTLEVDGKPVGMLTQNKAGQQVITLEMPLTVLQREALSRHIASFVRRSVMRLKAVKSTTKAAKGATATSPIKDAQGVES
jgi:ParB family chromosome partitioning protein